MSKDIFFIESDFKNDIYINVIGKTFPLLQSSHKILLLDYLITMLNIIAHSFNFDFNRKEIYEHQLKQNNYQDIMALLLLLLPFINDDTNKKKQTITSLNDIFILKSNKNINIDKEEPNYIYSNLQYGRCIRKKDKTQEIEFKKEYLDHNFYLLLNTIRFISNKLYINWIDILPYDIISFKTTTLYRNTLEIFEKGELQTWNSSTEYELNNNNIKKLSGLSMDDVYDTIFNELFMNIYNIKWILYDVILSYPFTTQPIPMLIVCNYIFDLDTILNCENGWETCTDELKNKFIDTWREFLDLVFKNLYYTNGTIKIDNFFLQKIARNLLYFFDKNYKFKQLAIDNNEYIPFKSKDEDIDNDDLEDLDTNISASEKKSLITLNPKHMYEYIRICIIKFKTTWYYRYIYDQNTLTIKKIEQFMPLDLSTVNNKYVFLTLKNIYNYAKSVTHIPSVPKSVNEKSKYMAFPKYWRSTTLNQKRIILDRLNNKIQVDSWFNIKLYIRTILIYEDTDNINVNNINNEIHTMARNNLIDIIFESLIMRGVLSYFRPFKKITDEKNTSMNRKIYIQENLRNTIFSKQNKYWDNSYYYLTSTVYSRMDKFYLEKENKLVDYFEYNTTNNWFEAYAMNWISQINFFNKYLNNRVIFATGSTGVGKSTQIPKLLLYALKAIDYKNTGSIACTQPRRTPTEKNAKTVSLQLGIPINDKKYYYVQFKHKNEDYTMDVEHLSLKFLTDGSLLQEIQNPIFKKMRQNKKTKINYIMKQNQYDVVIIDEAHEHNKNMDLILTLMKFITYYNNDIKLVIISATMDDDEPIYRRFYRDINDNRMYPLDSNIVENKLDRINVDRRLHISPPGKTTTHKITEFYRPNVDPINIIKNIVTNDQSGYILYFQPGIAEINKEITKLNKILPQNIIAIPFHSKLNKFQRDIVENIDSKLRDIKISKSIPFSEFDESINNEGKSKYDSTVIVATNIAEASLTIEKLKYVIETGTQKTSIYNFRKGGTALIQKTISDSSRLQRKGRVGRTSPGTVYYIYSEGTTQGIKTQYDISISNIYLELYDRLYDSYLEKPIFTNINNPNIYGASLTINSLENLYEFPFIKGLVDIIRDQYFIDDNFYNYFGIIDHYDYQNSQQYFFRLVDIYLNGFSLETLTDETGKFYLIHPEELYIKRNILGEIVGLKSGYNYIKYSDKRIFSDKMISFWKQLLDNLFMSYYNQDKKYVIKTDFGKGISSIKQELSAISIEDFDIRFIYMLLYGMSLNISEQIIRLISMYISTMNDFVNKAISFKIVNGKYRKNINDIIRFTGNEKSDSDAILYLLNDFHSMLETNNISLDQNNISFIELLSTLKKDLYYISNINDESQVVLQHKKYFNKDIYDEIKSEINKGSITTSDILSTGDYQTMRKKNITKNIIIQSLKNNDLIKNWSDSRSIKYDTMITYIDRYLSLYNIIFSNENSLESSKKFKISELVGLLKTTIDNNINDKDKVTVSIMYGFKTQIVKKIIDNYYIQIYEPTIEDIYSLNKITINIPNTLINKRYFQNYILYLNEDIEDKTISGLHYIDINLMKHIGYVYSRDMIYNKYNEYLASNIKLEPGLPQINITVTSLYKKILNEIIYDLIQTHDVDIWLKLGIIFRDQKYLQIRRLHDINYYNMKQFSISENEFSSNLIGGFLPIEEYQMDISLLKFLFKKFEKKYFVMV